MTTQDILSGDYQQNATQEQLYYDQQKQENVPRLLTHSELGNILNNLPRVRGASEIASIASWNAIRKSLLRQLIKVKIVPVEIEEFTQILYRQYNESVIKPGIMVGPQAADAISAPIMQMTLNTFHTTGTAKNVTGGFDAIREIIKGSNVPKNPSCTISFKNKHHTFEDILNDKQGDIIGVFVSHLVTNYDPVAQTELFGPDLDYPYWYHPLTTIVGKRIPTTDESSWVLRLHISVDQMYKYRILPRDICHVFEASGPDLIKCIHSPVVWTTEKQNSIGDNDQIIINIVQVPIVYIDIFPQDQELWKSMNLPMGQGDAAGLFHIQTVLIPSLDQLKIKGVDKIREIFPVETPIWSSIDYEEYDSDRGVWILYFQTFRMGMSGILPENVAELCVAVGMRVEGITPQHIMVIVPEKSTFPDFDEVNKVNPLKVKDYITPTELITYYTTIDRQVTRDAEKKLRKDRAELIQVDPIKGARELEDIPASPFYTASIQVHADTNGSNLINLLNRDDVDPTHTYSNNLYDTLSILGVEAVRNYMIWALRRMISASGQYINQRHIVLLIDYMTFAGGVSKASFSGIRQHGSVLSTVSYQKGTDTLASASLFGENDPLSSVSANIFTGKRLDIGPQIEPTDEMMEKIVQMCNSTDPGGVVDKLDSDDISDVLLTQEETFEQSDDVYDDNQIAIDDTDANLAAHFTQSKLSTFTDDVKPTESLETRIEKRKAAHTINIQSGLFSESLPSMNISGKSELEKSSISQTFTPHPIPIQNKAMGDIVDTIGQVPCDEPDIETIVFGTFDSGLRTGDIPDSSRPPKTQYTIEPIQPPTINMSSSVGIGIPPNLMALIQEGLEFQYPDDSNISRSLIPSSQMNEVSMDTPMYIQRSQDRIYFLKELLDEYYRIVGQKVQFQNYMDIGCGSGDITIAVKEELNIQNVYGGDIETSVVQKCPNFLLIKDNKISLPDNTMQLMTSYVTLHHFSDYPAMMKEITRVLVNGGLLFIREHDADTDLQPYLDLIHVVEAISRGENMQEYLPTFYSSYWSKTDLINSFKSYGLDYIAEKTYDSDIPNPQQLYHMLFTRNEDNQTLPHYDPPKIESNYNLTTDKRFMLDWLLQKYQPYYNNFATYVKKKLEIQPQTLNIIIQSSTNDMDLYEKLFQNKS